MRMQRGLDARAKLVDKVNRARLRERQVLENLEAEKKELEDLHVLIKSWKYREESKEFWMQLRLLRRFESACASGILEACHVQERGVEPQYSIFKELIQGPYEMYEGYEDANRAAKTSRDADERKRKLKKHQQSASGPGLVGIARVRATECPKYSYEIIQEERVPRVHHTLGEYLDYTTSPAGVAARRLTLQQTRRETTLFGPFLETGEYGQTLAAQIASEALGLLFMLPISLPFYVASQFWEIAFDSTWAFVEECVVSNPFTDSKNLKRTGIAVIDKVISKIESFLFSGFRQLCSIEKIKSGSQFLLDTAVEGTLAFEIVSFLDYNRYSLIMDTFQIVEHNTKSLQWVFGIAYRSPITFFTFLSTPIDRSLLPVHRDACTLRAAADVLRAEQIAVADRLRVAREASEARIIKEDSKSEATRVKKSLAAHGDWEALLDSCVKITKNQSNGLAHNYELCFFGEAKQDRTSVGKFSHWEQMGQDINASLVTKISGNPTPSEILLASNQLGTFDRLVYTDGQRCLANKKNRISYVYLQCGEQSSIIAVSEIEVRFDETCYELFDEGLSALHIPMYM
jgi:hypothetical protein